MASTQPTVTVTEKLPSRQYHERLKGKSKPKSFQDQYKEVAQKVVLKKLENDLKEDLDKNKGVITDLNTNDNLIG